MANLRSGSTKKGRGKIKKSLTGRTSQIVMKNSGSKSIEVETGQVIITAAGNKDASKDTFSISRGMITRNGRIRKKSKDSLKVMDHILKTELLISDDKKQCSKNVKESPTMNGNNNNDIAVSNHNEAENKSVKNNDSPKRLSKRISKINPRYENSTNLVGKIRIARNLFNNSDTVLSKNQETTINTKANVITKENFINSYNSKISMDQDVRDDVINKMKSIISPEEENSTPDIELKKYVKKRVRNSKPKQNIDTKKTKKVNSETIPVDKSKTKQVTLSNGVVLTLSLVQCDHCQKCFSNKASLTRHMFSHFDLKPYHCQHCPKRFRYRSTLKLHMQRRHPSSDKVMQIHICHICDKTFQLLENLELHLASHVKTENNFKCLYCDKTFSYRLLLIQHEKTHHDSGRFKCYLCEMTFDCRSRLSNHLKSHTKVKEYICQYCGKEFLRLNSIKRHVGVCHGGHRIQCPICFKNLKGHLTEHMRVHEQKRPHVCVDCGQRFTQSTQLKVHRRSHTGDRPYNCRICNRPFGHSNALMLHIRRHTGEKPFPCAMCPMMFSQLPHMKAHMSKIHGKDSAYKCSKCEQFFKLKAELEAHSKTCTVGDRELTLEEKIQASVQVEEIEVESVMSLSKMRFLLALLLTMIASKEKLKYLGFNKRLIDELLVESLEAMGHVPCKDETLSPLKRLKTNIEILLDGTIPKHQMDKFKSENKTTEELLILLTDEKKNE